MPELSAFAVTVNSAGPPPSSTVASPMARTGSGGGGGGVTPSSSRMVPTPSASAIVAPVALLRVTVNVSSCSSSLSSITVTSMVAVLWPAENVSVPLVLV